MNYDGYYDMNQDDEEMQEEGDEGEDDPDGVDLEIEF